MILVNLLLDKGHYISALEDYKRAIKLDDSCKAAYINRSVLYLDLLEKENDTEKKEELRQSAIDDLRNVLDIDKEDKKARAKLAFILRPSEEVMIARIDEKMGDLEIEEKNYFDAWKQYAGAIIFYLSKILKEAAEYSADFNRVFDKLHAINNSDLFSLISASEDELYDSFYGLVSTYATRIYISGNKEYSERLFLYLHNIQNHGQAASLNLAYMKRRGETTATTYSVHELLLECEDRQNSIWCVNTALCHLNGVEGYEKDWYCAINSLIECEAIEEAAYWWGNVDIVGEQESNIVMLLLNFVPNVFFEDCESVETRINLAIEHGYEIPDDIIGNLKGEEVSYNENGK